MDYGTSYYYLSNSDYTEMLNKLADFGFDLDSDFVQVTSGPYAGWYASPDAIDVDEMEWLTRYFTSFDLRTVNLSTQAAIIRGN